MLMIVWGFNVEINNMPYIKSVKLLNSIGSGEYPFNIQSILNTEELFFHENVTFFIGENGSGKSTLIESIAIALGMNAEGGNKNTLFKTKETHSDLFKSIKFNKGVFKPKDEFFLRAESFYNLATLMDDVGYLQGYGGKSLHEQSHGESFWATITNKLKGQGLYIMDEPEAALSPMKQMAMLSKIHDLVKNNSQFIIATHSPILLSYPSSRIFEFTNDGILEVSYEDSDIYNITKLFLNNYNVMLDELLK